LREKEREKWVTRTHPLLTTLLRNPKHSHKKERRYPWGCKKKNSIQNTIFCKRTTSYTCQITNNKV
jgi:hypothetical protein